MLDLLGVKLIKIVLMKLVILGSSLVSWASKKQNSIALSTTEVEYIIAGSCCAQSLWMKQILEDSCLNFDNILLVNCV
jgi:hypothetical protein